MKKNFVFLYAFIFFVLNSYLLTTQENGKKDIHYFEKKELKDLLVGLDIINLQEYESQSYHPPEGKHKHWAFDVVARKSPDLKKKYLTG